MGLLDDAIREHLDLKRRRGADPVEIERAEQEALGPVRRAPEGAEEDQFGPEVADAEGDEMLEETPEFLQDTPEHDRLWFEQRPPRDFDFEE